MVATIGQKSTFDWRDYYEFDDDYPQEKRERMEAILEELSEKELFQLRARRTQSPSVMSSFLKMFNVPQIKESHENSGLEDFLPDGKIRISLVQKFNESPLAKHLEKPHKANFNPFNRTIYFDPDMEPSFYEANGKAIKIKVAHAFGHENVHAQDESVYNLAPAVIAIQEEMSEYMENEEIDLQTKMDAAAVFSQNMDRVRDSQEYLAINDMNEMRQEEGLPIRADYAILNDNTSAEMAAYQSRKDKRPLSADMLLPPTSSDGMKYLLRPKEEQIQALQQQRDQYKKLEKSVSSPLKEGILDGNLSPIDFAPDSGPLEKAKAAFNDDSWQPSEETVAKTASDVPTKEEKEELWKRRPELYSSATVHEKHR